MAEYIGLLGDRRLLAYGGAACCYYAGSFAYIAASPFAYITLHHVPARLYGLLFGSGIVGIMLAGTLNSRLVGRHGSDAMLRWGGMFAAVAGVAVAITTHTGWGGIAGLAVPLFVFVGANGLIVANAAAGRDGGVSQPGRGGLGGVRRHAVRRRHPRLRRCGRVRRWHRLADGPDRGARRPRHAGVQPPCHAF